LNTVTVDNKDYIVLKNDKNEDEAGNDKSKLINKYQPLYNLYKGKDNNGIGIDPK
jgi:hypothetical protein